MKVTFLEADVPLTKTFFMKDGKIDKIGHPRILNYTSHVHDIDTIEALFEALKEHASKGHCFLKGNVTRPLVKEPRAGTTNPNEPTSILLLDIDGIKGDSDVASVLAQCKLLGADYIVQWSSSSGVIPERGMSAHVFVLLREEQAPAILKQYLIQWNLSVPILQQNIGLTKTYNALRWPLDITTCQNDKLIYIAPPLLRDGIKDQFDGERIILVKGKTRHLILPEPFPNAESNATKAQEKLNELRKAMGLKDRAKTVMRTSGTVEYLARPDRAVVTGIKESDEFVYLNLNGGDSWGYYHPKGNPKFIYNFKSEPAYLTSELLPDYWRDVKESMQEVKPDAEGNIYLAFRDFRTATYYNGIYNSKYNQLKLAVAKSEGQLRNFLMQYEQPADGFIPDWNVLFNPHSDVVVDTDNKTVNTFVPSPFMRMKHRVVTHVPPTIRKILMHALGDDEDVLEHFLNWLAVILQYRCATGTAWVLHGTTGTGKGLILRLILRPLFGMDYVISKRIREIDSQFNGYMEQSFILWVDEAEQNDFNAKGAMNADIKNFITEPRISIRKMHTLPYEVDNYLNWILSSNAGHIVRIDVEDRRFNVAVYQPNKLIITDAEIRVVDDELVDFYHYLMTRDADRGKARTPLNNQAKRSMVNLNMATIDTASEAIRTGNLEYFWEALPQGGVELPRFAQEKADRYTKLLKDIVKNNWTCLTREELQVMLDYTIGGLPETPGKFSSMMKHHKLNIVPVSREGKTMRGVPTRWTIKPEWKE